jgi:hypothetical protein
MTDATTIPDSDQRDELIARARRAARTGRSDADDGFAEELDSCVLLLPRGFDVPFVAVVFAWPGFNAEARREAWDIYHEAVRRREALSTCERYWWEFYDEQALIPADSLTEAAIKKASTEAARARSYFLHGEAPSTTSAAKKVLAG